ncbi:MAG: hypothetical protein H0W97_09395 [Actinobacteria bacterium]|nr:hypothetical protein [Actinomycetota bacterium]
MSLPDWEIFASLALACGGDLRFETLDELHEEMGELLAPLDPAAPRIDEPPTADADAEGGLTLFTYPLLVDEGRLSERADELKAALADPPFVEIHPDDAGDLVDGADVLLKTAAGEATLPVRVTEHVAKGSVFVPFNQAGFQANRLFDGGFVTSVTIEPVAELVDAGTGAEA